MNLKFVLVIFGLFGLTSLWAKTVIVPKRETAKTYLLSLTNLKNNETLKFESKNGKFELPEELDGEFSIQISFTDKWGRIIQGQEPRIVKIISKIKAPEETVAKNIKDETTVGIIFAPYFSQGQYQADLENNLSGIRKIDGSLSGLGIKTILNIKSIPQYYIGLERFQGTSEKADLNFSEVSIQYKFLGANNTSGIMAKTGLALNSAELQGGFQDGEDTVTPEIQALSAYALGSLEYIKSFSKFNFTTNCIIGFSLNYYRYSVSQFLNYKFNNTITVGPWAEYSKYENGNSEGSITSNLLSIGLNLSLNL
jgi:hypothetical protein